MRVISVESFWCIDYWGLCFADALFFGQFFVDVLLG